MYERGRKRQIGYYDIEKAHAELKPNKIFKPDKEFRPKFRKNAALKITLHSAFNPVPVKIRSRSPSPKPSPLPTPTGTPVKFKQWDITLLEKAKVSSAKFDVKEVFEILPDPGDITQIKSAGLLKEIQNKTPEMIKEMEKHIKSVHISGRTGYPKKIVTGLNFAKNYEYISSATYPANEMEIASKFLAYQVMPEIYNMQGSVFYTLSPPKTATPTKTK